jgi:MerR family transcriptional regulator, heat shock protein HspR
MATRSSDPDRAIYIISVAAELAGVHPQTLRVYERKGLVSPHRTPGKTRRYSERDIERLRRIQDLTNEGINLAGVIRILELELEMERLRIRCEQIMDLLQETEAHLQELSEGRNHLALVPLKDVRRIRRALKSDVIEEATRPRRIVAPPIA